MPGKPDLALVGWDGEHATVYDTLETGESPSFLLRRGRQFLAAHELPGAVKLTVWRVRNHALMRTRQRTLPFGAGLCHMAEADGALVGSCWKSGNFFAVDDAMRTILWEAILPGEGDPHPHASAMVVPGVLACCDMGRDTLAFYRLRENDAPRYLSKLALPAQTGPRQIISLQDGRFFVVCETAACVLLCRFRESGSGVQCEILDRLALAPQDSAWPGGACLTGTQTLVVPVRGTNTLALLTAQADTLCLLETHKTKHDWARSVCALPEHDVVLAAQQKAGCIEAVSLSGARPTQTFEAVAAPACIIQV